MSDLPPIEIRWGGGRWPSAPKRRLRPQVATALELAQLGLHEYFGMTAQVPMRATVWCVPDTETIAAAIEADRPEEIELDLGFGYIKHPRKTSRVLGPLVMSTAHELAHAFRLQAGHRFSLVERAASEGISMHVEQTIGAEFGIRQAVEYDVVSLANIDPIAIDEMRQRLVLDDSAFTARYGLDDEIEELERLHGNWFEFDDRGYGLPDGYLLGVHCVGQLVSTGVELATIAQMPAEQILGLE